MENLDQTFMRFLELKIIAEKRYGRKDLAICASPRVVRALKNFAKTATGKEPEKPSVLFGLPVYELEELPPEKFLICDQAFAQNILKNRIPWSED